MLGPKITQSPDIDNVKIPVDTKQSAFNAPEPCDPNSRYPRRASWLHAEITTKQEGKGRSAAHILVGRGPYDGVRVTQRCSEVPLTI